MLQRDEAFGDLGRWSILHVQWMYMVGAQGWIEVGSWHGSHWSRFPWHSHTCVIPPLWVWPGHSDLLLTNTIWQKWWDPASKMKLLKSSHSLWPFVARLLWRKQLPRSELPSGEAYEARKWGRPLANSSRGTEALISTIHKELNPRGFCSCVLKEIETLANTLITLWESLRQRTH